MAQKIVCELFLRLENKCCINFKDILFQTLTPCYLNNHCSLEVLNKTKNLS